MSTLTIRMPDDKVERLKVLANRRKISLNKLIDELATVALTEHDARVRFEARSLKGDSSKALELLRELDQRESGAHSPSKG